MPTFFGTAITNDTFVGDCLIERRIMELDEVLATLATKVITSCVDKSHEATVSAMRWRFGFEVSTSETPPEAVLKPGDNLIVLATQGLPVLTDRKDYDKKEVENAEFEFTLYSVTG
jgi:hypothetical protein